jgi:5'-3' exonuclease
MILVDFNQIALSNIFVQKLNDENMIRHMILNSLRMYNSKYRKEYGNMVICCDAGNTWRKEYFPFYKANRKKSRDKSDLDFNEIFRILNLVREEISANLPYKLIQIDGCEADDIIATLAMETQEFGKDEKVMIISSDKDFIQLQKYGNVSQFSPMQKKSVTDKNPRMYLFEHVIRGDSGDGIPNILSSDDTFVTDGKRQTPVSKKKIEHWLENAENLKSVMDEDTYRNYQRNKKLIDLTEVPTGVKENIINTFEDTKVPMRMKVLNYLIKKRCNLLIDSVEEFYTYG